MQPTPTNPSRRVFVDTGGWAEIFYASAPHHASADAFYQQALTFGWQLITSNFVLSELVPLFRSRNFRLSQPQTLDIITRIRAYPYLVLVTVDAAADQQAWDLLYANPQHPWSHVDATSMVLMRQLGIAEVLTADHHFAQAGFTVLL
jgi:uncharacterized protein